MTTARAREWFTPAVIINIVVIVFAVTAAWYGNRSDIRSLTEKSINRDEAEAKSVSDIKEQVREVKDQVKAVSDKIPDGAVIEFRLKDLEARTSMLDPTILISVRADIEGLKRESARQETRINLNQDYMEGRIFDVPYRVPSQRHNSTLSTLPRKEYP